MPERIRIEALSLTIGGGVDAEVLGVADREARAFAVNQFRPRERLVEMTIPDLGSPNAGPAGGGAIVNEDASTGSGMKHQIQGALFRLGCGGPADTSPLARTARCTVFMIAGNDLYQHFRLLNDLAGDRCLVPEIRPVHEFVRQGGTHQAGFLGCQRGERA